MKPQIQTLYVYLDCSLSDTPQCLEESINEIKNLRSLPTAETLNWLRGLEFGIPFLRGFIFLPSFLGHILDTNEKNECFKVKTILKF